jgi:hypothetical protein
MRAKHSSPVCDDPRSIDAALAAVADAGARVDAAKAARSRSTRTAERELCEAVKAARELNIAWGRIANVLGIARGNAYQRYRPRRVPVPRPDAPAL